MPIDRLRSSPDHCHNGRQIIVMPERPAVLAIVPGIIPSTIIGVIKPLLTLHRQGKLRLKVHLSRTCRERDIEKTDVVVFCRNTEPSDLIFLYEARRLGKKIVYEIDDNFFEIESETPLGKYHRHPMRLFTLREFLRLSDMLRVYSQPMVEICSKYAPDVRKIDSYFDFDIVQAITRQKTTSAVRIVYATSRRADDGMAALFEQALVQILDHYGERVEVYIWGECPPLIRGYTNVFILPFVRDYNRYIREFYEFGFDIGLAPLVSDTFHKSKTNNKFREFGGCGVAGIYSNVDVYTDCVRHLETGVIVENHVGDWESAISLLIEDTELRQSIAHQAHEVVVDRYSFSSAVTTWKDHIDEITNRPPSVVPAQTSVPFVISHLKILVLIDRARERFLGFRTTAFYDVCSVAGATVDVMYDSEVTQLNTKYDLVVWFSFDFLSFTKKKHILRTITCPLVVDLSKQPTVTEFAEIRNISSEATLVVPESCSLIEYGDILTIPGCSNLDALDRYGGLEQLGLAVYGYPLTYKVWEGQSLIEELATEIVQIPKQMELIRKKWYSIDSSVVLWAELLGRYPGTHVKHRFRPKIPRVLLRLRKAFHPVRRRMQRITRTANAAWSTAIILFKINVFRRF